MLCNRTDIVYMCITTLIFIKKLSFHVFRTSIYSCWFSFRKFLTFSVLIQGSLLHSPVKVLATAILKTSPTPERWLLILLYPCNA